MTLRKLRWAGNVARMWEMSGPCRVLFRKPEERLLGRPRRRREDNIKMKLRELVRDKMDCIDLVQNTGGGIL